MPRIASACVIVSLIGFVSAAAPALADGAALFAANCAACHGPDGKKEVGPNKKTIAGMDATAVPSHMKAVPIHGALLGKLSDEDLQAIAAAVAGMGG